jgi:hypothetical protein
MLLLLWHRVRFHRRRWLRLRPLRRAPRCARTCCHFVSLRNQLNSISEWFLRSCKRQRSWRMPIASGVMINNFSLSITSWQPTCTFSTIHLRKRNRDTSWFDEFNAVDACRCQEQGGTEGSDAIQRINNAQSGHPIGQDLRRNDVAGMFSNTTRLLPGPRLSSVRGLNLPRHWSYGFDSCALRRIKIFDT